MPIKELRLSQGLTQEQLAIKANIKLATLQKLERGASSIAGARVETIHAIAQVLGVSVEKLLDTERCQSCQLKT